MFRTWILIVAVTLLSGCQTLNYYKSAHLGRVDDSRTVLIMPPDVELSELSAAGAAIPKAEWTDQAKAHMDKALRKILAERRAHMVNYQRSAEDDDPNSANVQLIKLHNVVGNSAIVHHLFDQMKLPNKHGNFDWTLGDGTQRLVRQYGTDFALFT